MHDLFDYVYQQNLKNIPSSLIKHLYNKDFATAYTVFDRSVVLEQAIYNGWIKIDEHPSRTIGISLVL